MTPAKVMKLLVYLYERYIMRIDVDLPGIFLHGSPGIGKSAIVKALAEYTDADLYDVRLPLIDPTELRGLPYFDHDEKKTIYFPTAMLPPSDTKKKTILFLDEINAAPALVQAQAYQLIHDRQLGDYELPKNCFIIAAGNKADDNSVAFALPTALANRFAHVEVIVSHADWNDWANNQPNFDDFVIAFLKQHSDLLHDFDPTKSGLAFSSPRSWSYVSSAQHLRELDSTLYFNYVSSLIGHANSGQFSAWMKNKDTLPDPEDILSGKDADIPETPDGQYYLMGHLINTLFDDENDLTKERIENYIKFARKYEGMAEADMAVAYVEQLLAKSKLEEPIGMINGKTKKTTKKSTTKTRGNRLRDRRAARAKAIMGESNTKNLKMEIIQLKVYEKWAEANKKLL